MNIYTAQYRYSGTDRFDITVKGQDPLGKLFAPTWKMVMGIKNQTMAEYDYVMEYSKILVAALTDQDVVNRVLQRFNNEMTLVCFCPKGAFCHRYFAAAGFAAVPHFGTYKGDR